MNQSFPLLKATLLCFIIVTLVGCAMPFPSLPATPTALPPTPLPAKCNPPEGFYQKTNQTMSSRATATAGDIYLAALTARANNQEAMLARERSRALQFLAYETLRWSRVEDIHQDGKKLRMALTFISPELIQAVLLNYIISNNLPIANNNLQEYTQGRLRHMDERGEYLFLLTLQAQLPENAALVLEFRPKKISLRNSQGFSTFADRSDETLNGPFDMASGNQRAGFIGFPQAVKQGDECKMIFEAMNDKKISLTMENVEFDGEKRNFTFDIPFASPLGIETVPTPNPNHSLPAEEHTPAYLIPAIQDIGLIGPAAALTNDNLQYWQSFGRFVWANLVTASPFE